MKKKFDYKKRPKGRCYTANSYRLVQEDWPLSLQSEFKEYKQWRTGKLVQGRPRKRMQRESTFLKSVIEFEAYFGYLVNIAQFSVSDLKLSMIYDADQLRNYAYWHAKERADGPSRFIEKTISVFLAAARHYFQVDESTLQAVCHLKAELEPDIVYDKQARWNSLVTLESVGLAEYPAGEEQSFQNNLYRAVAAQRSLIIRLLVRRPLRSRNIREMRLGRNLYSQADGWVIEFQGTELKVGKRDGRQNIYRMPFPDDLGESLDEFLDKWRPVLNKQNLDYVFLSVRGQPISGAALNSQIRRAIYTRTGRLTNIHMFRDIWATEYISSTQNFTAAAVMLNDELETVLRRYTHLRASGVCQGADDFLEKLLR